MEGTMFKKVMYYCPNCYQWYSGESDHEKVCEDCKTSLIETQITADEWHSMAQEEKDAIKTEYKEKYATERVNRPINSAPEEKAVKLPEYMERMANEIHVMYILFIISIILSIISMFFASIAR